MDKWLGKIESARFGYGGYQDAQFGASFTLSGSGCGVSDFWGFWGMKPSSGSQWGVEDQDRAFAATMRRIQKLMDDAKVQDFAKLKGVPVEAEFEGMRLKSWRVLTEVL